MQSVVTAVVEEYLEAIYRLQERDGAARTTELTRMLSVTPGTITNTVERLEREGYLTHEPYKGVKLTEKGSQVALHVIRKHRLSERLLTDILHLEWEKAHVAACELEHGITDDIIGPLEKALGHPDTCPHGNPIPRKDGGITEEESQPLAELSLGERGTIMKVGEERDDLLQYIYALGLVPGATLEVVEEAPFDGPLTLNVGGKTRAFSRKMALMVWVRRTR